MQNSHIYYMYIYMLGFAVLYALLGTWLAASSQPDIKGGLSSFHTLVTEAGVKAFSVECTEEIFKKLDMEGDGHLSRHGRNLLKKRK